MRDATDATSSGGFETAPATARDLGDLSDAEVIAIRRSRLPPVEAPTTEQRAQWTPWDKHWTVFGFLLTLLGYPQTAEGTRDALHELMARRLRTGRPIGATPSKAYVTDVLETARREGKIS